MSKKMVKVFPVAGRFVMGVPHIEQEVESDQAEYLVETGAFALRPDPAAAAPEPAETAEEDKE